MRSACRMIVATAVVALVLVGERAANADDCYTIIVTEAYTDPDGTYHAAVEKEICPKEGVQPPSTPDGGDDGGDSPDGSNPERPPSWFDQNCVVKLLPTPPRVDAHGTEWRQYRVICGAMTDGLEIGDYTFWAPTPPTAPDAPPPPPSPEMLARLTWAEMSGQLPSPAVRVAPADTEPHGFVFVQVPAFFWVDDFQPVSRTVSAGSVWVRLTIEPVRVDVDLGNSQSISCSHVPPFGEGDDVERFDGCGYTYRHSSATAANGETFPVTATVAWQGSWTSSTGAGGTFPEVQMQSPTRQLGVAEIQAIVTDVGAD